MKNIAIIGIGNMGGGHALAIHYGTGYTDWQLAQVINPDIEAVTTDISKILHLQGVWDIDPVRREWAEKEGMFVYANEDELFDDPKVDIVLVALPNHLHCHYAIKAMRAGKHVLCEKPVTPTSAELEEILKVSKETGKVFYPRQNRRWDPDFLAIKKIYDEQPIGKPLNLENRIGGGGASGPFGWRAVKAYGGGMMLDWGVHLIDRILQLNKSKVSQVACQTFNLNGPDKNGEYVDEGFNLRLVFEDGFNVYIESGAAHFDSPTPAWRLTCEKGIAEAEAMTGEGAKIIKPAPRDPNFVRDFSSLPTRKPTVMRGEAPVWFPPRGGNNQEEPIDLVIFDRNSLYRNLVACIEGTEEQIVTGEQALRVLRVMETALKSGEMGGIAIDFEK